MQLNFATPVLVADDHAMMGQVVRSLLEGVGFFDIDCARSGGDALDMLKRRDYGLVICDWNMTPVTGLDLLQRMRADKALADIPFIMITAHSQEAKVKAAMDSGASSFIVKPFSMKVLREKIEACFS